MVGTCKNNFQLGRLFQLSRRKNRKEDKSEALQRTQMPWEELYQQGIIPWQNFNVHPDLVQAVENFPIAPGSTLDIGCGAGSCSLWLASKGFDVTGIDLSPTAVEIAKRLAAKAGVDCHFIVADFLKDELNEAPFSFIFDKGCFHYNVHSVFVYKIAQCLEPGGLWFSLAGCEDKRISFKRTPPLHPPAHTAETLVKVIEPFFEIIQFRITSYALTAHKQIYEKPEFQGSAFWAFLLRKRW